MKGTKGALSHCELNREESGKRHAEVIHTSSIPALATGAMIASHKPTSMIGLCQEGKSSPDALRRSACTKLFLIPRRVCWPLSRGSFFQIRTRLPFAVSAFQLHRRLSLCFLPVSKLINEGIQSLRSFAQSA
jgi:hypothetical protein